jgi:uncharacterized protein YjaZ
MACGPADCEHKCCRLQKVILQRKQLVDRASDGLAPAIDNAGKTGHYKPYVSQFKAAQTQQSHQRIHFPTSMLGKIPKLELRRSSADNSYTLSKI